MMLIMYAYFVVMDSAVKMNFDAYYECYDAYSDEYYCCYAYYCYGAY